MTTDHNHQHCIEQAITRAEKLCELRRQRLTPLRKQVLSLIWQEHKPVGAYYVLERLKVGDKRSAPPTVYRAIEFLIAQGLIHRIASLNAFIGCANPEAAHLPQFLICQTCQHTEEMSDKRINGLVYQSAHKHGFKPTQQMLEIHGQCANCQTTPAAVTDNAQANTVLA